MKWKDITSYSQGDKERIPRTFIAETNALEIVVSRHIHHDPDAWVLRCRPWYDCHELCKGETAEKAQVKAIELVSSKMLTLLDIFK